MTEELKSTSEIFVDEVTGFRIVVEMTPGNSETAPVCHTFIKLPDSMSDTSRQEFSRKTDMPPLRDGTFFFSEDIGFNLGFNFLRAARTLKNSGFEIGLAVKDRVAKQLETFLYTSGVKGGRG